MTSGDPAFELTVPEDLVALHVKFSGEAGRAWTDALPGLAADILRRWELEPDGLAAFGAIALVLPVRQADGAPAVLKLQPVDVETAGEPVALRAWNGDGAVRLLRHDPASGTMLLERLDAARTLRGIDDLAALQIISELLARLVAVQAPAGIRRLADVVAGMLDRVPRAVTVVVDPDERRLIRRCAGAVAELLADAGDRLLHWDLHYGNVLARGSEPDDGRGPWLAIDPKPLAGDPGFELLAALHNRWDDVLATGDVTRAVRRRFDLMTEVLDLDRQRAVGWTAGRVLENLLWEAEHADTMWQTDADRAIAGVLLGGG